MSREELLALAERCSTLPYFACPFCGEGDFDMPGYVFSHEDSCEVRTACINAMANDNLEVSTSLRARADKGEGSHDG